ncbi:MAG: hypothetical protein ACOH2E_04375 [Candidatus Paracaedibacter sp.]
MFVLRNIRKDSRSQNLAAHSLAPVVQVPSGPQLPPHDGVVGGRGQHGLRLG